MSKETSTIIGQRFSWSNRTRIGGQLVDVYVRLDPVGQHGRDLAEFLKPVQINRPVTGR